MKVERENTVVLRMTEEEAVSLLGMLRDVDPDNWDTGEYVAILREALNETS